MRQVILGGGPLLEHEDAQRWVCGDESAEDHASSCPSCTRACVNIGVRVVRAKGCRDIPPAMIMSYSSNSCGEAIVRGSLKR